MADTPFTPHFLIMGQITRPHGVRGELKMQVRTNFPQKLFDVSRVYLSRNPEQPETAVAYVLAQVRHHGADLLLTFEEIETREQADLLRGQMVLLPFSELDPLEEDEIYLFQLIGMAVHTQSGQNLGVIKHIMPTGANDVYIIDGEAYGELLIPDTDEVIQHIDTERRIVTIHAIPGLLPDED